MKKQKINNLITFGGTAALCITMSVLMSAGTLDKNNMLKGLLIPMGIHIILALSLNLTVGILGELSLGHAGFMCVGALFGGTVSQIVSINAAGCPAALRLVIAIAVSGIMAAVFGVLIGIPGSYRNTGSSGHEHLGSNDSSAYCTDSPDDVHLLKIGTRLYGGSRQLYRGAVDRHKRH